jgi:Tfp pilus assembly PilM family ATPase
MLIGIDIGLTAIKIVELDKTIKPFALRNFALVPIVDNSKEGVATLIKSLLHAMRPTAQQAALTLPYAVLRTKNVRLPQAMPTKAIAKFITLNLGHYFNLSADELYFDFSVWQDQNQSANNLISIFAVDRALVKWYRNIMTATGIELRFIEPTLLAMQRTLYFQKPNLGTNSAIVAMEQASCEIIIFNREKLFYAAEKPIFELPLDINSETSLLSLIAEQLRNFGLANNVELANIVLCGEKAAALQPSCNVCNPFNGMQLSEQIDQDNLFKIAPAMVGCVGAALRENW